MGIDTSLESLRLAARLAGRPPRYRIACMDAARLGVPAAAFDAVVCVQNGVRALSAAPLALLREALRVTRPGGVVLLSTYAEEFWPHRLEWFERQAEAGLIGRIDRSRTVAGTIVCEDGLRLGTFAPADFLALAAAAAVDGQLTRVDGSSLVWEVRVGRSRRAD
jgi:SAM-dependent methyltransferase